MIATKQSILILTLLVSLIGCASQTAYENERSQTEDASAIEGPSIHAHLMKTAAGYRFVDFKLTESNNTTSSTWVRLNDRTPMWNIETEKNCTIGISTGYQSKCRTINEKLFREFDTSLLRTGMMTVLSFGLEIAAPNGNVIFNRDDFNEAYDEASKALNESIKQPNGIFAIMTRISKAHNELSEILEQDKEIYNETYNMIRYTVNVKDESELYDNSINFRDLISFRTTYGNREIKIGSFSTPTLSALETKYIEKLNNQKIAWQNSAHTYKVICDSSPRNNFIFVFDCPDKLVTSDIKNEIQITAIVKWRNYKNVLPKFIYGGDDNISFEFSSAGLRITNNSNQFFSISSMSFYYNTEISTLYNLNIELPPNSISSPIHMNNFPIKPEALEFSSITRANAQSRTIEYGFAIKYLVDNRQTKSLFSTKPYRLSELLNL